jgi:parallel beta-helix repeat protein
VGVVVLGGGTAAAVQQLSCGDTITTDVTLHHNLVNCPNNGIVIGADNITLDLNYHTIDGDGKFFAPGCNPNKELCDVGVANLGHDGLTLVNGSLRQFFAGTDLEQARHNRVLGISATRNSFSGFLFFKFARSLVRNSSGSHNPAPEGDGMILIDSHHVRVLNSSFRHNAEPGLFVADSAHNLIKGNRFSRNDTGMSFEHADRNRVRRNRIVRDGEVALPITGSHNVITRNHIKRGDEGIVVAKGHDNLVAHNVVVRTREAGIALGIKNPFIGGAHNVVRRNLVRGSREDGFVVQKKDRHGVLKRNIALGARDDGFDVEGLGTKLTRNKARRNRDLGIEAVRGVIDGGGNIARHTATRASARISFVLSRA